MYNSPFIGFSPRRAVQYAFLLTKRNQYDQADEVLRHILMSNAYQSRVLQDTIRVALLSESRVSRILQYLQDFTRDFLHEFGLLQLARYRLADTP